MKKLTDKELISFFQERMGRFEADPLTSWETLEPKLNAARKKTRLALWIFSGLTVSTIIFTLNYRPSTTAYEKLSSTSGIKKLGVSDHLPSSNNKKKQLDNIPASDFITTVQIPDQKLEHKPRNLDVNNHKTKTGDFLFSSALQVGFLKIKKPVFQKIKIDTNHDERSSRTEVFVSGFISYNSAYFQPLNYDQTRIQHFRNSSNLFDNRLGFGLSIKLRRQLKRGNKFEYFGGLNYLKKIFEYDGFVLSGKEQVSYFSKQVNAIYFSGLIGGALHFQRTPFRTPVWVSFAFQQSLFKSELKKYLASNQVTLGMGIPFDLGKKFEIVPQVRYSIPLKRNLVDFQMNNIAWGVELNYKLKK
jgi:hypothetical protein